MSSFNLELCHFDICPRIKIRTFFSNFIYKVNALNGNESNYQKHTWIKLFQRWIWIAKILNIRTNNYRFSLTRKTNINQELKNTKYVNQYL